MSAERSSSISDNARAKPPLALKRRQLSAQQRQQPKFLLGEAGETRAAKFLISLNYTILDQNIRLGTHEIDIIALDPGANELVFVEVKTRSTNIFGSPSEAVTLTKLRSLQKVARAYKRTRHLKQDYRFDIVAVLPTSIEQYQNITWNF